NTANVAYRHESRKSLLESDPAYLGGYHNREGLAPPVAGAGSRRSIMYRPKTLWTWAFLLTTTVQAMIVLALESYIFAKFQLSLVHGVPNPTSDQNKKTIPTYLTLFIFGFLYQVVLVYDSLRLKNTIQVIGLCMYNGGMLIYAAIQYDQIQKAINYLEGNGFIQAGNPIWNVIRPYLLAVPCIIAFFSLVMSFEAWKLYDEFAWTIYKHISADLRMKRRFLTFQIFITLLKFDFFFFLGFTVQFVVIVSNIGDAEKWVTVAAIPVTIIILLLAAFWTRRENKVGMLITIVLFFGGMAYFIFKLARMYSPSRAKDYLPVRKNLTSFAVLTIILIVMTIINACACMANFNKGLKPHITKRKMGSEEEKIDNMTELPDLKHGNPASSRMTID
ncbi:Golgi apparatus membrane, partial [Hyphodiscus hymeniophilus]